MPEILKVHRARTVLLKYELYEVPLVDPELAEAYKGQVLCR
jgi:hypothetical protein